MTLADVHFTWGWATVVLAGIVGLWGLGLAIVKREIGMAFKIAVGFVTTAMLGQVGLGLILYNRPGGAELAGNQHLFYGVTIAVTFAFAYIYRIQFAKRPGLAWGLLMLFVMGLALRGIDTFGRPF